jgi:hypothetical protein
VLREQRLSGRPPRLHGKAQTDFHWVLINENARDPVMDRGRCILDPVDQLLGQT